VLQQRVSLGIIEPHPVRHCGINVDYHDVTPIGSRPVPTRPVDPICSPQQVRQNLWWQGTLRVLTDRTPQPQASTSGLPPSARAGGSSLRARSCAPASLGWPRSESRTTTRY
jgi:hypothetical protein